MSPSRSGTASKKPMPAMCRVLCKLNYKSARNCVLSLVVSSKHDRRLGVNKDYDSSG